MPKTRRPAAVVVSIWAPLARQHPQADAALRQLLDNADEMVQVASEPVELPDHQGVAQAQRLETGRQARAVILLARGAVLVDGLSCHAGFRQGVILEIQVLCVPGLGDAGVADVHVSYARL